MREFLLPASGLHAHGAYSKLPGLAATAAAAGGPGNAGEAEDWELPGFPSLRVSALGHRGALRELAKAVMVGRAHAHTGMLLCSTECSARAEARATAVAWLLGGGLGRAPVHARTAALARVH